VGFAAGARLGPYEIQSALGAGGMGEVYRARDTRLKRDVAIKVLPEAFAQDPDRLARFQREAELLATLNHPNIAAVYGLEQADPSPGSGQAAVTGIVLELVEGETLADQIARGPVAIIDALPIARQIADALEAAHEKGVIHRDLKPANIKITADGKVKVLDFGLAKLTDAAGSGHQAAGSVPLTMSPTLSVQATYAGVILGTAAYMSPEQARGRTVDKRTDVWAFGCVLYEMLTGTRPFGGEDLAETIGAVIHKEPAWATLPAATPVTVRTVLQRCLEKDPKQRIRDIGDVQLALNGAFESPAEPAAAAAQPATVPRRRIVAAASAALLVGAAVAALATWALTRPAPAQLQPMRLEVGLGADASLVTDQGAAAILSPDGQILAFIAQKNISGAFQLYVRRLDQLQATPLMGTDGARNPFFSPDGQWIAFFADRKLKKISVTQGIVVTLCDAPSGQGGSWADDGTIVFTPISAPGVTLLRVSSAGGTPRSLTVVGEGELAGQRWPQVLPGGKAVLYTVSRIPQDYENADIVVQSLPTGPRKVVHRGGSYGRYVSSGHLVYVHDGTIFAAPFDPGRLEVTGEAVPAMEGVATNNTIGGAQFAVSDNGTLAYYSGQQTTNVDSSIEWTDRQGKMAPLRATPANWGIIAFAPDGRRLAIDISDGKQRDVWVYEWARDGLSRLTFDPSDDHTPAWTPDSGRIVFASTRADKSTPNIYWQRADGTGDVQRLTESKNPQYPSSWHPGGKFLAFTELTAQTTSDIMILPMEGDEGSGWKPGKPTVFLNSPAGEWEPMFSPDGRWLAYSSSESGGKEVYVRPFPGPGGKWQVSTGGGATPTWSRTRHELFYAAPDGRIMVAPYSLDGNAFRVENPRPWSEGRYLLNGSGVTRGRHFDLHPDGDRLAVARLPEPRAAARQDHVTFIFNFFDELRRLAPVKK
jgi:serine/threonine-protein kinase